MPASLRDVVHRAHRDMALVWVALAGVLLLVLVLGLAALRVYMGNNLQLVARSLAYTVEAAVVFGDREEAQRILARMLAAEGVAQATVQDGQGATFVQWAQPGGGVRARLGESVARGLWLQPAAAPIHYDGARVGQVVLRSDGQDLLRFLALGLLVMLVCVLLSAVVGMVLSRRMLRDTVTPLQALAQGAHTVHRELEARHAQLEQQNAVLSHKAHHDSLTGLPNRGYFEQRLDAAVTEARAAGGAMAVLFIDNDHFKQINDTLGHAAGDTILVAVAERIRAQLRETDVVARLGGDEFAVLLAPVRGADDAVRIADKILQAMAEPVVLERGGQLTPSVSIGVALFPGHGQAAADLLSVADAAMYHAKNIRRGSHHVAAAVV